jgi:acetolactate synthase I/II/III large subunit
MGARAAGPKARALLDLQNPELDFVKLGTRLGIPSRRVDTAEHLVRALDQAVTDPGPRLIEAVIPAV